MINWSWITTTGTTIAMVVLSALGIYIALIVFTRLAGLRSFSKLSSFDFAITVAIGTVLASTLLKPDPPLLQGIVGLAALYGIKISVSILRRRYSPVAALVDNKPVLLMAGKEVLHHNMRREQMTMDDLRGKLREANVIHPGQIRAVVMEPTGDVSVLHADPDGPDLDPDILSGVEGAEYLTDVPNAGNV